MDDTSPSKFGSFIVQYGEEGSNITRHCYMWVDFPADARSRRIIKAKILLAYIGYMLVPVVGWIMFLAALSDWVFKKPADRFWGDGTSWEQMSVDIRSKTMTIFLLGNAWWEENCWDKCRWRK